MWFCERCPTGKAVIGPSLQRVSHGCFVWKRVCHLICICLFKDQHLCCMCEIVFFTIRYLVSKPILYFWGVFQSFLPMEDQTLAFEQLWVVWGGEQYLDKVAVNYVNVWRDRPPPPPSTTYMNIQEAKVRWLTLHTLTTRYQQTNRGLSASLRDTNM